MTDPGRRVLLIILFLAVVSRLAVVDLLDMPSRYDFDAEGYLLFDGVRGDEREYEGRGWNLSRGDGGAPGGDANAPPGLPMWVWLVYSVFGRQPYLLLAANALFGALAAFATFRLGRRFLPEWGALGAALGVALDPQLLFWSARILTEPPAVALGVLAALATVRLGDRFSWRDALLAAAFLAGGLYLRSNFVVFAVATLLWLAFASRVRTRSTITVAALFLLFVGPLIWINQVGRTGGKSNQAEQLAERGVFAPAYHERLAVERAYRDAAGSLSPEEEQAVRVRAREFIQTHSAPRVVVANMTLRARTFWNVVPTGGSPAQRAVYVGHALFLFSLAGFGLVVALRRRESAPTALLFLLLIAGLTLLHSLVLARPRYRLLLEPMLWLLASHAIVWLAARIRSMVGPPKPVAEADV